MNKKQDFDFSCGAASLLCAAMELGVTHIPKRGNASATELKSNYTCEVALYKITSGANTGGRIHQSDPSKLGYSHPHNVAIAARELGLSVQIYMSGLLANTLAWVYPDAELQCIRAGFPVIHSAPPSLAPNRRELRVVTTFGIGLHYVMLRPDGGGYMDPADGQSFPTFQAMNTWSKCYRETGITLVVERPAV
nr:hypothetical protein [uncultured Pseudomonas sp.]